MTEFEHGASCRRWHRRFGGWRDCRARAKHASTARGRHRPGDPAEAAPAAQGTGNDIVITGSRIRRNPLDLNAPRVFIDQADIQKTGLNSINDVLQRLPSSGGGINSQVQQFGQSRQSAKRRRRRRRRGARSTFATSAPIRTLVLVDGLRFLNGASASGVPGSVDLNSIPESMIERVEVLQDGASTIYGSDAIAGVVNIITKSSQKGFAASAQVGSLSRPGRWLDSELPAELGQQHHGPTQIVVGGNYVKATASSAGRPRRFRLSRFPTPPAVRRRIAPASR